MIRGVAGSLALASAVFAPWHSASADLLLNENFNYTVGDLYNADGPWYKMGSNTDFPIQVSEGSLTYQGYQDDVIGNKVALSGGTKSQSLWRAFDEDVKVKEGAMYVSFLMNVTEMVGSNDTWSFNIFAQSKAGLGDGKTCTEMAKMFIVPGTDATSQFKLAISRNGALAKARKGTVDYNIGETYLVVIEYSFVEGSTNDEIRLWVNPATDLALAPEETLKNDQDSESTSNEASTSYGGLMGIEFHQSTSATKLAKVDFDAIRVATAWADLFPAKGDESVPSITLGSSVIELERAYAGTTVVSDRAWVNVVGTDLKGDITVTLPEGITAATTTIAADEATASNPYHYAFTVTAPETGTEYSKEIVFSSEGAEDVTLTVTGEIVPVINISSAAEINAKIGTGSDYENTYRYTGHAVVTYIEDISTSYSAEFNIYAQDETGGICINTAYTYADLCPVAVGNEITDIMFLYDEEMLDKPVIAAFPTNADGSFVTVTATGKTVEPAECDANAMATDADVRKANLYKLYTVKGVSLKDASGNFEAGTSYVITDGENEAAMRVFAASNVNGSEMPAGKFDLTGISTSAGTFILMPRSTEDIVDTASAPSIEVSRESVFSFANSAAPINEKTAIFKYTVVAENLPDELPVQLTGQNTNQFSVEPSAIPAGSGTTVVTVYFEPTAVGRVTNCMLFINADAVNSELNYTNSLGTCTAYDPDNLPTITIEPSIIELVCAPGNTVKGTAVLNAENAFDYITATRSNTGSNGGLTINNTYIAANAKDVKLEVTFAPTAEGEFTETWTYNTTMGIPATLTVKAKCSGSIEDQPVEGNEDITIDWDNAYALYTQDFNLVESNKPLQTIGWSNVAVEGKRAWWGYIDGTGLSCAKVTAYDSAIAPGEGSLMVAELVSPALDYANAEYKNLKFRLMGQYLTEDSGDVLSVLMIDPNGDAYQLGGFDIPTTSDEAGEWIEYDVDMSVIEDMPEKFAIAFMFSGKRGRDNSTTYYIDDFKWGEQGVGVKSIGFGASDITPDADGYYNVYNSAGIRVLRTRQASDLNTLAPGLYITNGRKFIRK